MTTLQTFEEVWMCLMLVSTLMAQAQQAALTPDQMGLLRSLRARLRTSGPCVAPALQATADIDAFLAALEEG